MSSKHQLDLNPEPEVLIYLVIFFGLVLNYIENFVNQLLKLKSCTYRDVFLLFSSMSELTNYFYRGIVTIGNKTKNKYHLFDLFIL